MNNILQEIHASETITTHKEGVEKSKANKTKEIQISTKARSISQPIANVMIFKV